MSSYTKQATPNRCYCRIHDEETSLDDIAKIITILNFKILRLRNEVSALKNVSLNRQEKLVKCNKSTCERLSSKESDTFRTDVKFDKSLISEKPHISVDYFENNPRNNYEIDHEKIDNEIFKNGVETNNASGNEKLHANYTSQDRVTNTDCNRVFEDRPKIRKKKISKGIQCDSEMERKRKLIFFNCFKTDSNTKEHNSLKQNKRMKISSKSNIRVTFDPDVEEINLTNKRVRKNQNTLKNMQQDNCKGDQMFRREAHVCGEKNALIKIEPKMEKEISNPFKKFHENKILKTEMENSYLSKNVDERQNFRNLITGRMSGGAELRGNRLISDLNDKVQKINLYKNVKFDAKNVKRRLDACIVELNGIIDDVSLIFPNTRTSTELQK